MKECEIKIGDVWVHKASGDKCVIYSSYTGKIGHITDIVRGTYSYNDCLGEKELDFVAVHFGFDKGHWLFTEKAFRAVFCHSTSNLSVVFEPDYED